MQIPYSGSGPCPGCSRPLIPLLATGPGGFPEALLLYNANFHILCTAIWSCYCPHCLFSPSPMLPIFAPLLGLSW